jgi:alanine racemase
MKNNRTWIEIHIDALRENIRAIRRKVGMRSILVPVKADGYGHGGIEVSRVLAMEGIDQLGVASCGEGVTLRSEGISLPILILSPSTALDIPLIIRENLIPSVVDMDFALQLSRQAKEKGKVVQVHVEVETGMGRTGVDYREALNFILSMTDFENIEVVGVFTHFAAAEEREKSFTVTQLRHFEKTKNALEEKNCQIQYFHAANSAALLDLPETFFNLVRPGILVYGLYPSSDSKRTIPVKPVMVFKTRVVQLQKIERGKSISYGRTFTTGRDSLVAVLSVGYGDGYLRSLSNRGEVLIHGKRAKILGTVCMDLTMVDVTDIPGVEIGNEATLIGREGNDEITANEVAKWAGTIPYEIISTIGIRVSKVFLEKKKETHFPLYSEGRIPSSVVN